MLLRFKPGTPAGRIAEIEAAFCALRGEVDSVTDLEWGLDASPEGLSQGFTHAFLLSFENEAGRDANLPHPAHLAFVERLEPLLDGVLVIDYRARR